MADPLDWWYVKCHPKKDGKGGWFFEWTAYRLGPEVYRPEDFAFTEEEAKSHAHNLTRINARP